MVEREQILKEEKKILEEEKNLLKALNSRIGKLATSIERARIDEYTSMITRPWKFFMINFTAGIFRGLGMAIGFTLIAAVVLFLLVRILVRMVDLPIIGMYIGEVVKFVEQYLQQGIPAK
jgi:formate-dependent nitrite reductase membrane component NrfD